MDGAHPVWRNSNRAAMTPHRVRNDSSGPCFSRFQRSSNLYCKSVKRVLDDGSPDLVRSIRQKSDSWTFSRGGFSGFRVDSSRLIRKEMTGLRRVRCCRHGVGNGVRAWPHAELVTGALNCGLRAQEMICNQLVESLRVASRPPDEVRLRAVDLPQRGECRGLVWRLYRSWRRCCVGTA